MNVKSIYEAMRLLEHALFLLNREKEEWAEEAVNNVIIVLRKKLDQATIDSQK